MEKFDEPLEEKSIEKDSMIFGASVSLLVGLVVLIYFVFKVSQSHSIPLRGEILSLPSFGAFGDFIGGVVGTFFSLAGVFLLYLTLTNQRDNFHKERLESNFFEMIKLHRENVSEMEYEYYEDKTTRSTAEKRKVFKVIFSQFKEAWAELGHLFVGHLNEQIYEEAYLMRLKAIPILKERNIDVKLLSQVDIIYLIVFFGLSKEDKDTIRSLCINRYKGAFIEKLLEFASLKPLRTSDYWDKWETVNSLDERTQIFTDILNWRKDNNYQPQVVSNWLKSGNNYFPFDPIYPDNYGKYYGGHQFRLGHYFRHLFHSVKFIDEQQSLSQDEKYKLIKILRGQLSNYEQIIFFLNSLSEIGREWELEKRKSKTEGVQNDTQLVTKYNLIKNVPMRIVAGNIDILQFYPSIDYETVTRTEVEIKRAFFSKG